LLLYYAFRRRLAGLGDGRAAPHMLGQAIPREVLAPVMRLFCKGKIHGATVTEARLDYEGSVSIDAELVAAAGMVPYEVVQITNVANGTRWKTYVMAAPAGGGTICLNGPPARHFQPGDRVIILSEALLSDAEVAQTNARVVFVDGNNRIANVVVHNLADEQRVASGGAPA
jgi:aspartate 1-decarboxylase